MILANIVFSTNGAGKIGHTLGKKANFNLNVTSYTKLNSKCIMDLNIKCKTLKLEETEKTNYKLEKKILAHIQQETNIKNIYKVPKLNV